MAALPLPGRCCGSVIKNWFCIPGCASAFVVRICIMHLTLLRVLNALLLAAQWLARMSHWCSAGRSSTDAWAAASRVALDTSHACYGFSAHMASSILHVGFGVALFAAVM